MKKEKFYQDLITGKFTSMVRETVKGQILSSSKEVFNIIKPLTAQDPGVEQFWVIFLDSKNKVIEISLMFKGSITATAVYPREVLKKSLAVGATGVVCCHNHPSGDPEPSIQDINLTFQLIVALRSIDIAVHDHLVLGDGKFYSMTDKGIIPKLNQKYNQEFGLITEWDIP